MMNTDEITREPLDRWAKSPKRLNNSKACIWACAVRLMEARDPDAPAHISMVGNRIGLPEREIRDAIKNAARRTRWAPGEPEPKAEPVSDVSEIGSGDDAWSRPLDRVRPESFEPPEHSHGFPEDHPECADCVNSAEWFTAHEYDHYWACWVEKR